MVKLSSNLCSYNFVFSSVLYFILSQDIKYASQFTAESFKIETTELLLEIDAEISSKGRGYLYYTLGAGVNATDGGTGASHATVGGSRHDLKLDNTYGSLYDPVTPGSRGGMGPGRSLGSRGGGTVRIEVGHSFVLDGVVNVDADNASERSGTEVVHIKDVLSESGIRTAKHLPEVFAQSERRRNVVCRKNTEAIHHMAFGSFSFPF